MYKFSLIQWVFFMKTFSYKEKKLQMMEPKEHLLSSESIITVLNSFLVALVQHKLEVYEHCPKLQPYVGKRTIHLFLLQ